MLCDCFQVAAAAGSRNPGIAAPDQYPAAARGTPIAFALGLRGRRSVFGRPQPRFANRAIRRAPAIVVCAGSLYFVSAGIATFWGDGRPNQNATLHSCRVAAGNLWIAPSDHVRHLKVLQKRRCLATANGCSRMPRSITTFPCSRSGEIIAIHRGLHCWPSGVPNLQVINRSAHVEKCAQEAGERRVRAIPTTADRSPQTVHRPEGSA